jgi:CubicO group peptidase (beta-lactamase class C family)
MGIIRHSIVVLLGICTLSLHASSIGATSVIDKKVDSIFHTIPSQTLANHFVWVESDDQHLNPEWINSSIIGGIYLTRPLESSLESIFNKTTFSVALQLDKSLKINTRDDDPGLESLNALSDQQLIIQYAKFLIHKGRINGYDHLVLPELDENQMYLSETLDILHEVNPQFFLKKSTLTFDQDPRRKKFYENLASDQFHVIPIDRFEEFEKTLIKGPRKSLDLSTSISNHLRHLIQHPQPMDDKSIRQLHQRIRKESVIPFRLDKEIFPLLTDTLAIWSRDISFVKELAVYFPVVVNLTYEKAPTNSYVILDARTQPMEALDVGLTIGKENKIIWIGTTEVMMDIQPKALLILPELHPSLSHILPEMLYGSEPVTGQLKRAIPDFLADYNADAIPKFQLLGFASPEWLGMEKSVLDSIDLIADEMINEYASPGAQVMVVKEGKVVMDKNYGYITYDSLIAVQSNTIYDLASLTKVTATLLAVMQLDQGGLIHLDSTLGYYLPEYAETNKAKITIRQLLSHQAGLKSYLPFWKKSMKGDFIETFYYSNNDDEANDKRSYGNRPDPVMIDSLISWVKASPLITDDQPSYRYSDIGFMILHQVIESVSGMAMNDFLERTIYNPLGMYATCFNPMERGFELYQIAPTEYDYYFRDEQVWGQVHDRNAAVFGGIAGHAGLFSNSHDLALLLQMILQEGTYRRHQFLTPSTLHKYNQQYFADNRRGLGWDKPGEFNPNISEASSPRSFGHTGFTGTMVWVDPDEELIFIFLSNRIFPDAENKNLIRLDTRKRMHDLVYRSMGKP